MLIFITLISEKQLFTSEKLFSTTDIKLPKTNVLAWIYSKILDHRKIEFEISSLRIEFFQGDDKDKRSCACT